MGGVSFPTRLSVAALCVVALAGCGDAAPTQPELASGPPVASLPPSSVPPEGREPGAPPPLPAEARVPELLAYASRHGDQFGGLYLDRRQRAVVMLFTDDLAAHRQAVAEIAPEGVLIVPARYSEQELNAILDRLVADLAARGAGVNLIGASVDVAGNRVEADVTSDDLTLEAAVELAYGGAVDLTVFAVPGAWAQPEAGDGWHVVAHGEARFSDLPAGVARDPAEYGELWSVTGLAGEPPTIDFEREIAAAFRVPFGSTCREVRLDRILFDRERAAVIAVISDPLAPRACTADLVGEHVFVVALTRTDLPGERFELWTGEEPCRTCQPPGVVEIDLAG
ncbi:MAG TPA: hypothetical protein VHK06_03675 [Candidatus Limnocylindria bacterium]|nr:hypothetical protein [Candidatus Limnocylindria bacterium]